jgi:hypothetical protein
MAEAVAAYGENAVSRLANVSLVSAAALCLANLCAAPLLGAYLSAVDRPQRGAELRNFPVFGVPLLLLAASVGFALLWLLAFVFLTLPRGYGWFALALVGLLVGLGAPLLGYAFFVRLARLRHRKRQDASPALRDLSARELELLLARAMPRPEEGGRGEKEEDIM